MHHAGSVEGAAIEAATIAQALPEETRGEVVGAMVGLAYYEDSP